MKCRRLPVFRASVPGICVTVISSLAGAAERPNVVILVADDLGWADVSFHGDEIRTPNIDRLVSEGVELSRFYVCPDDATKRGGSDETGSAWHADRVLEYPAARRVRRS